MKGYTKCCTHCKKIIFRYCKVRGQGTMEIKCPHCKELVEITFSLEPYIKVGKIIPLVILGIFAVTTIGLLTIPKTHQVACLLEKW